MIDSRGCDVYAGFMQRTGPGPMSVYVAKIRACNDYDIVSDGAPTSADVLAFNSAFAAGDPSADLNRDGVLGVSDCARFFDSYDCGCNPP